MNESSAEKIRLTEIWFKTCAAVGDRRYLGGYFAPTIHADTVGKDFEACKRASEQGDERAQRYMAEFVKQRMTA